MCISFLTSLILPEGLLKRFDVFKRPILGTVRKTRINTKQTLYLSMSLEHAQDVMQRAIFKSLRHEATLEEGIAVAQVDLLYDLIEEVRQLRNDLYLLRPETTEPDTR